jgi:hypothetical protein
MEPDAQTRLDAGFRWPGGRRICVVFNVAFEGWSPGAAPGVGPMGNPLKPGVLDTNAISWGEYGPRRGIYRLLDVLDAGGVKASVMINGVLAERFPEAVAAVAERGHEAVAHSHAMDRIPIYLDEAAERENVLTTTAILEKTMGRRPTGWISPRGTRSLNTRQLLVEAGYLWQGDCFDDDLPYVETFGGRPLVAIPLTMEINDLPFQMRYGNPPGWLTDAFQAILARFRTSEPGACFIDATAHAHVFGRPYGAAVFQELISIAAGQDDIWIATREEVARHVLAAADEKRPAQGG